MAARIAAGIAQAITSVVAHAKAAAAASGSQAQAAVGYDRRRPPILVWDSHRKVATRYANMLR